MSMEQLWGGSERRKHIRSPLKARIRLFHESFDQKDFETADISSGGVFLEYNGDTDIPSVESIVKVQVQDSAVPAPVVEMKIVRKTENGFGLEFLKK